MGENIWRIQKGGIDPLEGIEGRVIIEEWGPSACGAQTKQALLEKRSNKSR